MRLAAGLCCFVLAGVYAAEPARDPLVAGFVDPPADARPLVFWQWVNGNVTQQGIRLDLEWMQRIGLAGALMFDIGFRTPPVPQYVEQRVGFGTPEWEQAVRFTAAEAKRLGLVLGAQTSGGWSVSGGPMVKAEQAMKKLVWSETVVTPSTPSSLRLLPPPANSGPYQDIAIGEPFREPTLSGGIAVIAYRLPDVEQAELPRPKLTGVADVALLEDKRYSDATDLIPDADGNASLLARFSSAAPRALTIGVRGALPQGAIEASADGVHFNTIIELPGKSAQAAPVRTFALPERSETIWRIRFTGLTKPLPVAEARFEYGGLIHFAQEKSGFGVLSDYAAADTATTTPGLNVDPRNVLDLSAKLSPDGTLAWRPREGRWLAVRFGWSLTGRRTVPATAESIGLEVDKLDANAVRAFGNAFYDRYARAIGDAGRLDIALADSWEAGQQNWTPSMFEEFSARRGYDLRPWLPVLTGRVIGDAARSERFLADYRRTIADLLADNHYGVLADVARKRGMSMYAEAAGTDLPTVIDGIQAKGRVDVPMGEYWFYPEGGEPKPEHVADVREAASAAHLYGHRIVAAEALTTMGEAAWATGPAQLRRIVDRFFAEGINRVALHTSAHQPFTDRKPGITLRQYGQHFTRNETWAEDAGAWVQYLARTSYLLQQGWPVADVAIFPGEDAAAVPQRLKGYDYDFVNAEALLTRLRVKDGRLTRIDGASFRVLAIAPGVKRMSLPVIRKLRALVAEGGVLIGAKPTGAVGIADDDRVRAVADELWGTTSSGVRKFGRGRVYVAAGVEDALRTEQVPPDVDAAGIPDLHWIHRALPGVDIYFVSNQSARALSDTVKLRVRGHAEQWDAVGGQRSPVSHTIGELTTTVHLDLPPYASRFVVFRGSAPAGDFPATPVVRTALSTLDGPWDVEFLDGQGAPARLQLPASMSWTENSNPAIRYYSGRARYTRTISIPDALLTAGNRVELDLGDIAELARISVNGRDLGVLWTAPFRRDITEAIHAGDNQLEITVSNYWANRLIGDEQPGATRVTFAPIRPYTASSPLRRSGLLGPVRLVAVTGSNQTGR